MEVQGMIYGREMMGGNWKVSDYKNKLHLVFERDPLMYKKIPCEGLLYQLSKKTDDGKKHYFYVFSDYRGNPEYVFVSCEEIHFATLDYNHIYHDDNVAIVKGALYNLKKQKFVHFGVGGRSEIFFSFVIYDSGCPHVVYDDKNYNYVIYHYGGFEKTACEEDPIFFSHVRYDSYTMSIEIMRTIFFKDTNKVSKCIILQDEIHVVDELDNAEFVDIIRLKDYEQSEQDYYNMVHAYDECMPLNEDMELVQFHSYHLVGDEAIIWRDNSHTRSEKGNLYFLFLNNPKMIDFLHPFYRYKRIEDKDGRILIKIFSKRNDLENDEGIYDLTERTFVK